MKRVVNEIGSEFWDVPLTDDENGLFGRGTQWYISGRSALKAILGCLSSCRTASLPYWCCESMIKPFIDTGIGVSFYHAYRTDGQPPEPDTDCDIILLMDYFGYSSRPTALDGYKGTVIRDTTHSLFSRDYTDADYYFGSLRKWCGVKTGGYAFSKDCTKISEGENADPVYSSLRRKAMTWKSEYISGLHRDKGYLAIYAEAEKMLESYGIVQADPDDISDACHIDIGFVRKKRRGNAAILMEGLKNMLMFPTLEDTDCPLFVPVIVPDGKRDELRCLLTSAEIYCPIHWPLSQYHSPDETSMCIYNNELSLVCDQRYSANDMDRIVETVKKFLREV